jgi:hypothetical protein
MVQPRRYRHCTDHEYEVGGGPALGNRKRICGLSCAPDCELWISPAAMFFGDRVY